MHISNPTTAHAFRPTTHLKVSFWLDIAGTTCVIFSSSGSLDATGAAEGAEGLPCLLSSSSSFQTCSMGFNMRQWYMWFGCMIIAAVVSIYENPAPVGSAWTQLELPSWHSVRFIVALTLPLWPGTMLHLNRISHVDFFLAILSVALNCFLEFSLVCLTIGLG